MKNINYCLMLLVAIAAFSSCDDDEFKVGNPVMDFKTETSSAFFGDSLSFVVNASDVDVPLSTLKVELYFSDEKVSETVIRTKVSGQDYEGKIYIPYLANIPDGTASLKYILQNINFTITEKLVDLNLSRPDFPYLTFVTEDGKEYKMDKVGTYEYSVTDVFGQKEKGYIKSPKMGKEGNEILFGWVDNAITQNNSNFIPFSSSQSGEYTISFNTYSYEASPFIKLKVNDKEMEMIDDDNYSVDLNLSQGDQITVEGVAGFNDWWIDPDYFTMNTDGTLAFLPISGNYRITANYKYSYLIVEALNNSDYATLGSDGSGAVWIIGEGIGKPSYTENQVGWVTEKGICMPQIEEKKYQATLVAGKQVKADNINFKFFHQKGWGGEFGGDAIATASDIVFVGDGTNGRDNGNLGLVEGRTLELGGIYRFTVDLTAGNSNAVLVVEKIGEEMMESATLKMNGMTMEMVEPENYALSVTLSQNDALTFEGVENLSEWWMDPDYFSVQENGYIVFKPVNGDYKVKANTANKTLSCVRLKDNVDSTLQEDGTGGIWLMGWGVGSPSLDNQFGWTPGVAYCLAEVEPAIYQFTGKAGPETGSNIGQRFRADYLSFKFFHQNGWGGEFSGDTALEIIEGADLIKDAGNFELADGVALEEDVTYVITVDLTKGNDRGTISFKKL